MAAVQTLSLTKQKTPRRWLRRLLIAFTLIVLALPTFLLVFVCSTRNYVFSDAQELPNVQTAIVFGAGLKRAGKPSLVLQARLDGAIDLYRMGKVHKLLMSGDNRVRNYNEPEAMRRYAVQQGIPNGDIVLDFAGRNTYDTCYRAKNVFGCDKAIVVTQAYHAPRAVYLARGMGIDAVAYAVPTQSRFPYLQFMYSGREILADLKATWDINVTHRKPYVD
jgi:vancomycin permeability regulator SanA